VLALTDVLDLLMDELAGLCTRRLALALGPPRAFDCFLRWHDTLPSFPAMPAVSPSTVRATCQRAPLGLKFVPPRRDLLTIDDSCSMRGSYGAPFRTAPWQRRIGTRPGV
jgi:hypothetical protein